MIANNSGSSHHTENLYPKTLESIYDNIVRIEKLLDILLIITRGSDK